MSGRVERHEVCTLCSAYNSTRCLLLFSSCSLSVYETCCAVVENCDSVLTEPVAENDLNVDQILLAYQPSIMLHNAYHFSCDIFTHLQTLTKCHAHIQEWSGVRLRESNLVYHKSKFRW